MNICVVSEFDKFSQEKMRGKRAYDQRFHFDIFLSLFYGSSSFTVVLGSVN